MKKHFKCKNCGGVDFTKYENKSVYYCNNCDVNTEVVYEFLYNPSTCESVSHTVSIHRTKKGAEMAMEFHKNEIKKKFENEEITELTIVDFPWHFDQWWGILETQLND